MGSYVHIFNYRLPGLWQNPAKLQLSKLPYLAFHTSSETRTCKESKVQVQRKIAVYLELSKILFCVNILIRQKYVEFYIIAPVNKFTLVPTSFARNLPGLKKTKQQKHHAIIAKGLLGP
jgi:hypothetical protein